MVAQTLRKGDLTEPVNSGFVGVPRELVPRVLEKLKTRRKSELQLQYCEQGEDFEGLIDPLGFETRLELSSELDDPRFQIDKKMWDLFFSSGNKRYGEEETGSAFEITKCYENKTKGLPDYFELDNCERNKRLEYMRKCGGPDNRQLRCTCSSVDEKNI